MAAETGSAYNYRLEHDGNAIPTTALHNEMSVSNASNEISISKKYHNSRNRLASEDIQQQKRKIDSLFQDGS
jgi:hypothetical protein